MGPLTRFNVGLLGRGDSEISRMITGTISRGWDRNPFGVNGPCVFMLDNIGKIPIGSIMPVDTLSFGAEIHQEMVFLWNKRRVSVVLCVNYF